MNPLKMSQTKTKYQYAELPSFKYQTFDRHTLTFTDVPIISLFAEPWAQDGSKGNADSAPEKGDAPESPPVDKSIEEPSPSPPEGSPDSDPQPSDGQYCIHQHNCTSHLFVN